MSSFVILLRSSCLRFVLTSALFVVAPRALAAADKGNRAPNIIFIFADDHAWQAISAYGDERELIRTPNIDRLAREGMRFDRCLVTNSICGPSRATVLTGKYSHLNGVYNNSGNTPFDGSQLTFPKLLQKRGYQTAIVGKWHLETDPTGFDFWQILPGQGEYYNPHMIRNGVDRRIEGYATDIITDETLKWLQQRDPSRPFLLMSQHKAPHRNWHPALRHLDADHGRVYPEPPTLFDDHADRGDAERDQDMSIAHTMHDGDLKLRSMQDMTPAQRAEWDAYYEPRNQAFREARLEGRELVRWKYQRYMHDYLACIRAVDESVGRVLDYLDETGLAENTIVVYSSDQGFFLGEHGWFDKRWIYEESLRTPLLVRWPGVTAPGSACDAIVSNLDFAETFLEAASVPVPREMQGRSLVPLLRGERPADWRQSFYYHYYEAPGPHWVRAHYGVVTDRYKLVKFYDGPTADYTELFDLTFDPCEMRDVSLLARYTDVKAELEEELARLRSQLGVPDQEDPRAHGRRDWSGVRH